VNIHLDPETFRPLIDQAVSAALAKLQAERPKDQAGRILLTKPEAAEALGVSPSTLDRMRKAGLPALKLDGLVLFRPEALRQWAAEREGVAHD
jgi:predicted DNA-binding transcriptional regulator AlpA